MVSTELLIERLNKMISDGRFPEQSKLPPERQLAEELDTTRSNLRQALAILEAEGKIWRHVGRGTFVGHPPADDHPRLSFLTRSTNPMEIMETRLVVEPKLAGLAALRATASEVGKMYRCIEKSETAADIRTYELWDATLHRTIAEAAGNKLLLSVFNAVNALREDKLWGRLKDVAVTPERKIEYSKQHYGCIEAIESRDVTNAERRMTRHLEVVKADMFSAAANVEDL